MVFLHYVFDLIEVFLGKFVAVLEDALNLMVNSIERVEILLLEMPFLGLVCQQRDLIGDFFIIFHRDLHSTVIEIQQLHEFEGHLTNLALITGRDILIFAISTYLFLLEVSIRLRRIRNSGSFHIIPPHA